GPGPGDDPGEAGRLLTLRPVPLGRAAAPPAGGSAEGDAQDAVVVGRRAPAAVLVAGGEPDGAVGRLGDGAQAAVPGAEPGGRPGGLAVVEGDLPEALAAERGGPERAARVGEAGRGRLVGRPGEQGVGEPFAPAGSLDLRPAVVPALLDAVDLVEAVLAELGGVHAALLVPGEPLDVAVAVGPHEVAEGVARGGLPVRGDAEDLAAERVLVL